MHILMNVFYIEEFADIKSCPSVVCDVIKSKMVIRRILMRS